MQHFDMHSTLFQIFPSSNTYASLVAGAATVLVKASVNHSKTIEELSNALDSISDAISLCTDGSKLIRSQAMQNAIAKLYIAVFLFFGDAIIWYKSSSTKKILNSLHKDFSEKFRKSVETIKEQAAAVRHAADLGSQAEVRVMRLDVEELREELHDARLGLSVEMRALAEYMVWQHGETLKQHEITQELLRKVTAEAFSLSLRSISTLEVESSRDMTLALPAPPEEPPTPATISAEAISLLLQSLITLQLELSVGVLHTDPIRFQTLFDIQLAQAVNGWLSTTSQQLLYLEFLLKEQAAGTDHMIGAQTMRVLAEARLPAVTFSQSLHPKEAKTGGNDSDADMIVAMLSIARDIIQQLPKDDQQSSPVWCTLGQQTDSQGVDLITAGQILDAAFQAAPTDLHIVLVGYPTFWLSSESGIKLFLEIVRKALTRDDSNMRVIIITQRKLHRLIEQLRPTEVRLITSSAGTKALKAPVMVRRAKTEKP